MSPGTAPTLLPTSIVVLPFADMSPNGDQEYFADGMAEELINRLSKIEDLRVVARTSAFAFKGKDVGIREIGDQLNVGAVVEGSVRKAGDRLRITAQLVQVADGFHVWSETYDRDLEDVFAIQEEIASAVAEALQVRLLGGPQVEPLTKDFRAYELYLIGRHFLNRSTPEGFRQAIDYYAQALEADPDFALAYVGLADAYVQLVDYSPWGTLKADMAQEGARNEARLAQADTALSRALAIDDTLGEAHASLGNLRGIQHRWRDADHEFRLALQLSPGDADAHWMYGLHLLAMGRHEAALDEYLRALQLDPLSDMGNIMVGAVLLFSGDYDAAIEALRRLIALNPERG